MGRLTDSEILIRSIESWQEAARIPLDAGRWIAGGVDGSLLAGNNEALYHLPSYSKDPVHYPRVPVFIDSLMLPDRERPSRLWVHGFGTTLQQYSLEDSGLGMLRIEGGLELQGYDHRGFLALGDGSFLYTTAQGLERVFAGGKRYAGSVDPPPHDVWRLLPTRRIDQFWLACANGQLDLVQVLGAQFSRVRSITLPTELFDIASNAHYLAAIRLAQANGQRRKWSLLVFDQQGRQLFETALPRQDRFDGEDWVQRVTRNESVVLASDAPLVAVGGPDWVRVWAMPRGEVVFEEGSLEPQPPKPVVLDGRERDAP